MKQLKEQVIVSLPCIFARYQKSTFVTTSTQLYFNTTTHLNETTPICFCLPFIGWQHF
jgi:hypothetical protein